MATERIVLHLKEGIRKEASKKAATHGDLIASGDDRGYRKSKKSVDHLLKDVLPEVDQIWADFRDKLQALGLQDPSVEEMLGIFKGMVEEKQQEEGSGPAPMEEAPPPAEERVHEEEAVHAAGSDAAEVRPISRSLSAEGLEREDVGSKEAVSGLLAPSAVNEIKFDQENQTIEAKGKRIKLHADEWSVLVALATVGEDLSEGNVLAGQVFGSSEKSRPNFNTRVSSLRKKLGESAKNQGLIISELRGVEGAAKPRAFYGLRVTYPEALDKGSIYEGAQAVAVEAEHQGITELPEEAVAVAPEAEAADVSVDEGLAGPKETVTPEMAEETSDDLLNKQEVSLLAKLIKENYSELISEVDQDLVDAIIAGFEGEEPEVAITLRKKLKRFFAHRDTVFDNNSNSDEAQLLLASISSIKGAVGLQRLMGVRVEEAPKANEQDNERYFRWNDMTYDREERKFLVGDSSVELTKRESDIFDLLSRNKGKELVYGDFFGIYGHPEDANVDISHNLGIHISRIRIKFLQLSNTDLPLKTVRGKGYIFE